MWSSRTTAVLVATAIVASLLSSPSYFAALRSGVARTDLPPRPPLPMREGGAGRTPSPNPLPPEGAGAFRWGQRRRLPPLSPMGERGPGGLGHPATIGAIERWLRRRAPVAVTQTVSPTVMWPPVAGSPVRGLSTNTIPSSRGVLR